MTKCYICDKGMDQVSLDFRDMKPKPCSECETAIQECLEGYEDLEEEDREAIPALEEDDIYLDCLYDKYDRYVGPIGETDLGDT